MNTKKKPFINEEDMGKNPFIVNQVIKARTFAKDNHYTIQSDEGINLVTGSLKESLILEEQSYTKIYHDVDYRDILLRLKEKGLKLFLYITYQITSNEDYIWINNVHYQNITKYTKQDYLEGVKELVRYSIITTTIYPEVYFINPMIFFSGNRLKKYPDNIKIRK